jgi:predicted esterase YcpF (UPF0227 family)
MRILFLHGLEGELSEEKRALLSEYGDVFSPKMDYRSDSSMIETLAERFGRETIDVVIGSSMGGFAGYYLSRLLSTPCLAFNPALPYRSVVQYVPAALSARQHYLQVVLGSQDNVIIADDTLNFLNRNQLIAENARVHLISDLAHRIPVTIFDQETKIFFNILKTIY